MKQLNPLSLREQNFMLAVRREMGWPAHKPANDCIVFCSGLPVDFEVGNELARIVSLERKDAIYTGWTNGSVAEPTFTVVYREFLTVDVVDRVVPFAESEHAPLIFVNTRADEVFAVDRRGSLLRLAGKPKNIAKGKKLAMKRIKAAAAAMGERMLESNRHVPYGDWIAPGPATDVFVKFV